MSDSASIYKTPAAKERLMSLYDAKLASIPLPNLEEQYLDTPFGRTHVLIAGPPDGQPVVLLHGIHAGAPLALEAVASLAGRYRFFGIDSIGQATKSAETRPSLTDDSLGRWLVAVLDALGLQAPSVVGVSYGGFLLQRLIAYAPQRVSKAIFVVPGGFADAKAGPSMRKLFWPLLKFQIGKGEKSLRKFMTAFYGDLDDHSLTFQRTILTGVKMDYRKPPLATAEEMSKYTGPVYAIVVDEDVFFPGDLTLERCKSYFQAFREGHVLRGSKHIPSVSRYAEIAGLLDRWLPA